MIYVDMDLPRGALLDEEIPVVPEDLGGVHFCSGGLECVNEVPVEWHDITGSKSARAATPNQGNAHVEQLGGRPVLVTREGVNCGFALENVVLTQPKFSMAVLFASPKARAGTLLTLNPREGRAYLFMSESEGVVSMKYRDQPDELSVNGGGQSDLTLACASVSGRDMKLAVNGAPPKALEVEAEIEPGDYDLFIGCRSDRPGIAKTLGEARIASVWLWPDQDVFADDIYQKLATQLNVEARQ